MLGTMETYTRKVFDFGNMAESEICIEDIAHALSMTCRFNGHIPKFYSVAEHSCLAYDCASNKNKHWKGIPLIYLLLHDGSEAYLNDIVRPIKSSLKSYLLVEKTLENFIFHKLIENPLKTYPDYLQLKITRNFVKRYDNIMLHAERKKFFPKSKLEWSGFDKVNHKDVSVMSKFIKCWKPRKAEKEFLLRYKKISNLLLYG